MKPAAKKTIGILAILTLCMVPFALSLAGSAKDCGKLEGVIKDLETGKPLQNAYVSVDGCNTAAMTNDSGRFFLTEIPAGDCVVKIYKKGYKVHEQSISVEKKRTCMLTVELKKQPVQQAEST